MIKEFFRGAFLLPAKAFSGLNGLLFGSYKYEQDKDGIVVDKNGDKVIQKGFRNVREVEPGILGSILDGIKFLGRTLSNFVHNHEQAIATAFWTSLVVAGAAVLTVFLLPAALAAVTTFTIAGVSIASVVGTGLVAQLGAVAAVAAAVTSAAVYLTAGITNTINWISDCFTSKNELDSSMPSPTSYSPESKESELNSSIIKLRSLSGAGATASPTVSSSASNVPPVHTTSDVLPVHTTSNVPPTSAPTSPSVETTDSSPRPVS